MEILQEKPTPITENLETGIVLAAAPFKSAHAARMIIVRLEDGT
jgi:hypothetical protein